MLYRTGRYSVDVGPNGSIKVKPGDWLSKYSAAMFNTYFRVHEFGRLGSAGMAPVADPNLIFAGETIFHMPTYFPIRALATPATEPAANDQ